MGRSSGGGGRSSSGGELSDAQMREIQPENAGNSRVFEARRLASSSNLTQSQADDFDLANGLQQTNGINSAINAAKLNNQKTIVARTNQGGGDRVSVSQYSKFTSQANKDLTKIYSKASEAQKNRWALELGQTTRSNGQVTAKAAKGASQSVKNIRNDLNERLATIRRREEAADRSRSQSASRSNAGNLDDFF